MNRLTSVLNLGPSVSHRSHSPTNLLAFPSFFVWFDTRRFWVLGLMHSLSRVHKNLFLCAFDSVEATLNKSKRGFY